MNLITGLLLIIAVIVFAFLALPMAISAAWGLADWIRERRQRRAMRQVDELLRGEP